MRAFALSTGSSGNSFFVESSKGNRILIDVGLSYSRTKEILNEKDIDIKSIDAILITHEHSDHILGLPNFLKNLKCKFYITKGTLDEINYVDSKFVVVKHHENFDVGDFKVFVIDKPHDAKEAVSYIVDDSVKRLGVFTDLGHVSNEIKHILRTLDFIFLEANYCENHIKNSKDNYNSNYLNRLMSDVGHLGLHQCYEALIDTCNDLQKTCLSHVSENTTTYENTYMQVREKLAKNNKFPELLIGFQGEPTEWVE